MNFKPTYKNKTYSYDITEFFESESEKIIGVLEFENDEEFSYPPRFRLMSCSIEI